MAGPPAGAVFVSSSVRRELKALIRAHTAEQRYVLRARIVLWSASGLGTTAIARRLDVCVRTVQKWRGRFCAMPKTEALEDEPRSGRPPRVTLATRCQLLKLACSKPEAAGAKFRDVWSYAALADSLEKACGVRLSRSEIGATLRAAEIRPHRVRYWLHSPDPDFAPKVDRLYALYLRPPKGATVLCIDEKTCIQALDRPRPLVGARRCRDRQRNRCTIPTVTRQRSCRRRRNG